MLDTNNPLIAMAGGRRPIPLVPLLLVAAGALLPNVLASSLVPALFGGLPSPSEKPYLAALELFAELVVGYGPTFFFLWVWLRFFEGRPLSTIGFFGGGRRTIVRKVLFGSLLALAMLAGATAFNAALGGVVLERDGAGLVGFEALGGVIFLALGWAVQGSAEEVAFRGWVLQTLGTHLGVTAGVLLSSVAFAAMHLLRASGWTAYYLAAVPLFGRFCALYALYEGSLWGVCAFHATYNWGLTHLLGLDDGGQRAVAGGTLVDLRNAAVPLPEALPGEPAAANLAGIAVHFLAIAAVLVLARRRAKKRRAS